MASASFDEKIEEKKPTVQVGDPFTEKLLLEACLELMAGDSIIAIQDMGAAAPISCIAIIESPAINSKQASSNSFSVNGSPTWTVGFFSSIFSSKLAEAILAPCIPSLPVLDPT